MFRGRIHEVIQEVVDSLVYLDPDSLISDLVERLMESRVVAVTRRDLNFIARVFQDKTYFGPACIINRLSKAILSRGGRPRFTDGLIRLSRVLEEQYDRLYSVLNGFLDYDESIGVVGYSRGLLDSLLYSRSKIKVVYALESYPVRSGKMLVSQLRRENVRAYYVPDESVLWVASRASKVIIPVYGSTSDGYTVVEPGGFALASTARHIGTPVIGVYPPTARCMGVESENITRSHEVSILKRFKVRVAPFDLVKPEYYDRLITHEGVAVPRKGIVEELSGLVDSVIEAIIG